MSTRLSEFLSDGYADFTGSQGFTASRGVITTTGLTATLSVTSTPGEPRRGDRRGVTRQDRGDPGAVSVS